MAASARITHRPLVATFVFLALVLAWDMSGFDMAFAQVAGTSHGFPLRDNWWLAVLLHDDARRLAWVLALGLCLAVWWPVGFLARIPASRRLQLAVTTVVAALAVSVIKTFSHTSCPWDLEAFGGAARHLSHWSLAADGGSGRCFPAGHASSGFCFLGGYFAFRDTDIRIARIWLVASLAAGLALGLVQQWRGAHFMSHTLWTGFICWSVAYGIDRMAWVRRPWVA